MGIICGEIADGGGYPAVRVNACGELMLARAASTMSTTGSAVATTSCSFKTIGSVVDTLNHANVSFTVKNLSDANTMEWRVVASNASDLSSPVVVSASAQLSACGTSSYAVAPAPYRYYAAQGFITTSGSACTSSLNGVAKG